MRAATDPCVIETAHRAGMAEVANGVLHNVGNVLNTLNISLSQLHEMHTRSPVATFCEVLRLMIEQGADLPRFLEEDLRGQKILLHLPMFETLLQEERGKIESELNTLRSQCQHLRDIVAGQQAHATGEVLLEEQFLPNLVSHAIELAAESVISHQVQLKTLLHARDAGLVAKTKLLQVMVNLLRNACEASCLLPVNEREIRVHLQSEAIPGILHARKILFSVHDNGQGIAAENLTKIFAYGFTTKANGHGFGLHSCANVMTELAGTISAFSPGLGQGATFTITFPMQLPRIDTASSAAEEKPVAIPAPTNTTLLPGVFDPMNF